MAVNDGDNDGGNGEGRANIGRRQEGREVAAGRGASNLMQPAMRGDERGELAGREVFGWKRGELSVFDVGLCALQKVDRRSWTGGEVYSLSAAFEPNPLLQVPGRSSTKTSEFCHHPQAFDGVPRVRLPRPGNALTLVILF
jgi:hypothetical protein